MKPATQRAVPAQKTSHRAFLHLTLAAAAICLTACSNPSMPAADGSIIEIHRSSISLSSNDAGYRDTLQIYWFGSGCHLLRLGNASVLTDPFVSNGCSVMFPKSNKDLVAKTLGRIRPPNGVIVNHGHHDHILDAGAALALPGWENVMLHGGKTTCNVLAGWNNPSIEDRCLPLPDGISNFTLPSNRSGRTIRITAYPGVHGPHLGCGYVAFDGKVEHPRTTPPNSINDYHSGEVFNYLVQLGNYKIFYMGAVGAPEMTPNIPGGIDALILCAPGSQHMNDIPRIPLERLRPRHVILGHHNTFLCDAPDERLSLLGKDISYVDLISRRVQNYYKDHPADKRFETIEIPAITVMEPNGKAKNVILIRKPGA